MNANNIVQQIRKTRLTKLHRIKGRMVISHEAVLPTPLSSSRLRGVRKVTMDYAVTSSYPRQMLSCQIQLHLGDHRVMFGGRLKKGGGSSGIEGERLELHEERLSEGKIYDKAFCRLYEFTVYHGNASQASGAGWLITWCTRESHVRGSRQTNFMVLLQHVCLPKKMCQVMILHQRHPCTVHHSRRCRLFQSSCSGSQISAGINCYLSQLLKFNGLNCILSSTESGDTYQRQVLSIFSIASGICLLGVACMALYRRNKRHREKLQAHFSDSRSLRDCSVNASGLMSKSAPRLQYCLQIQKGCGSHGSSIKGSSVAAGTSTVAPPILSRALSKGKRFRSSSLSLSPAQQRRETNYFRTPPISRGKHKISTNIIDGSRVAGHVYKHLQEDESTDMESIRRCDSASGRVGALLSRTSLTHFAARKGWTEVPCTRLDKGTTFLPPSLRTRSVPIIPSLQASDLEASRVDTSERNQGGLHKWHPALAGKATVPISNSPSPPCETVVLAPGVKPGSVRPPSATSTAPLGTEKNPCSAQTPCSIEITVELAQELKQKSLSSSVKMSGSHSEIHSGGTNTLEAGTVQESERKGVQYSARVQHTGSGTRGLRAAGQREAQGQCQGQASLVYGGANCSLATKGPSCRGTGNAHAKPSAS
ncbi:hypothetical protein INR49_013703 [Caranx melampygus]|nr:hypothetical protein INR49_013703 [Caranx melampygus]